MQRFEDVNPDAKDLSGKKEQFKMECREIY